MNARVDTSVLSHLSNRHLDALEEETIFVLREVAAPSSAPPCCFRAARIRWSFAAPKRPSAKAAFPTRC
jgi:hypothetical protein